MDYTQLIKVFDAEPAKEARYSPPRCTGCIKRPAEGSPKTEHASTSYVERQDLTLRMGSRRFTRLPNGFSNRIENHAHAVALHDFHYSFFRKHMTLKTTPAVAAGKLVQMDGREERLLGGRLTDYLPASESK